MKKQSTIILCAILVILTSMMGCTGKTKKPAAISAVNALPPMDSVNSNVFIEHHNAEKADSIDKHDIESLMFWTSEKIGHAAPELVSLLDTLYRYVRDENTQSESTTEKLRWMGAYRKQLCDYYDLNKLGSDTIANYTKADSVLSYAEKIWETGENESTTEIIVDSGTFYTWTVFRQYNLLIQLLALCENDKQKSLLIAEWEAWEKLEKNFREFSLHCIDLCFGDGSISGIISANSLIDIWNAHIEMSKQEFNMLSDRDVYDKGVFISCSENLLIDCCNTAIKEYFKTELKNEYGQHYLKVYNKAIEQNKKLKPLLKNWIKARNAWTDEVCRDYNRNGYKRNTSEVLSKLANIISSLNM